MGNIHRSGDIGMLQAEYVAELVKPHRLDVEASDNRPDDPLVFGVVEVNWLGQGVRDHAAAWWKVGMSEHSTDHGVIGIVGRPPVDGNIGVLCPPHLREIQRCSGSPGGERVAHRLELAGANDVIGPILEGVCEVRVRP